MPNPFYPATFEMEQKWLLAETGRQVNPVVPGDDPEFRHQFYMKKKKRDVDERWSLLSFNSKMRCLSFDLPSLDTCPGANRSLKLTKAGGKGICSLCYAAKGPAAYPRNISAMKTRYIFSQGPDFVDTMIAAISDRQPYTSSEWSVKADSPKYFRIHSSGDFYNAAYVNKWVDICSTFPGIKFWAPTRVWSAPASVVKKMTPALAALSRLSNVILRPSMIGFNDYPKKVKSNAINWAGPTGALIFTTITPTIVQGPDKSTRLHWEGNPKLAAQWERKGVWFCPATPKQKGDAKETARKNCTSTGCRRCWNKRLTPICYAVH